MAKTLKKTTATPGQVTKHPGEPANLVLHQLILRNIDRSQKDVGEWRIAHRMAEAVMNPTRRRLWNLIADVELDGTIRGTWKKRVSAVVNKKVYFSRDGKRDESFDALIKTKAFRRMRKKRMEEHSHGIVGFEFTPGQLFDWKEIPRRHIRPDQQMITIEEDGYTGFKYGDAEGVMICEGEEQFGFLLYAAPYALFKKGNYGDWAQYVEIFGQPVIITKYDGYDETTRTLLEQALQNAGSSLRLMLPKQSDFEMMDGKTSNGDGSLQDTFKNALNNEIMILILGNTETTGNSNGGSLAKSKIHADQQLEITKDDMEEEMMFLNDPKFLSILKNYYGYNTDGVVCMYETEVDNAELESDLKIDEGLLKAGVPLDHDYFYEKYHRPKPANYDQLVQEMKQNNQPQNPPANDNLPDPANPPKNPDPAAVAAFIKGMSLLDRIKLFFQNAR